MPSAADRTYTPRGGVNRVVAARRTRTHARTHVSTAFVTVPGSFDNQFVA